LPNPKPDFDGLPNQNPGMAIGQKAPGLKSLTQTDSGHIPVQSINCKC